MPPPRCQPLSSCSLGTFHLLIITTVRGSVVRGQRWGVRGHIHHPQGLKAAELGLPRVMFSATQAAGHNRRMVVTCH